MTRIFGKTESGLTITSHHFGRGTFHVLVLGGVHGDEVEGVVLANALLGHLLDPSSEIFSKPKLRMTLVPTFNLDGVLAKTRGNARGVDLNRNLSTKDWSPVATTARYQPGPAPLSESENRSLTTFIENEKPNFIISLHSWKPMLNINEPDDSTLCRRVAERIASFTGDIIEPTIGYSTPGCLGTYAGLERGIPTITYEIERGLAAPTVIAKHLMPLTEGIKLLE